MDYRHHHDEAANRASEASRTTEAARVDASTATIRQWFGRHANQRCFLSVDPSQRNLNADFPEHDNPFADLPRADVVIDHEAFAEAHRPYLLELDLATDTGLAALAHSVQAAFDDRLPASMASGLGQRIGGWLASPASLEDVAAHWSRLALQRDAAGRACVLRFYDTRALDLLWTALSPAQQQALLGPVKAWHALDACARLVVRQSAQTSPARFALLPQQWDAIHRHGLVNRALALHAYASERQPQAHEVEAALAAAARAERYGLLDRDDQIAFIGHAIAWHPQFDLHPKVLQLLGRRADDDFYSAAISRLSADEIAEIRQGAWYDRLTASASR
ncbi:DUF4123 domain-containing protein [Paraburkholderia sp. Ac-20336]|uniref:DUF4123 domain-containing protein n=1 Tax=Paraburkholderia sp. Ac-20336 TaxID=2703886 RepID=UPI001981B05D|nr:DUF4123 domain-containing protein [Paraburkholderia sp. Ac-20336]MBN3802079.1 DUF4123 domain-containing protein [Paraburkholderia sp. Ac-20336]